MKRLLVLVSIFICSIAHADTETINWYVDGTSYATTTCQTGGDIILPNPPTKYGYTFQGWAKYIPIEYLESTGTQYIDTGFSWNNTVEFDVKFTVQQQDTDSNKTYFGAYGPKWDGNGKVFPALGTYTNYRVLNNFIAGYSGLAGIDIGISNGQTGTLSLHDNIYSWSEGRSLLFDRGSSFFSSLSVALFGTNAGGVVEEFVRTKIYFANFWLNGRLVHSFIPVLDNNGTPCMYDKVTDQFFYNQGTGNFIAGPVIN